VRLSQHFSLAELTASEYAARHNLNNEPDARAVENLKRLAAKLEEVRAIVKRPIIVTSGYRSPAVNRGVGGSATSQHCFGLAADIKVHGMTPFQVCQAIERENIAFDQLIHEFRAWTHISIPDVGKAPRNMRLTFLHGQAVKQGIVP
jgi:zinc D-Ala-D-Ala carboxypeptidase